LEDFVNFLSAHEVMRGLVNKKLSILERR